MSSFTTSSSPSTATAKAQSAPLPFVSVIMPIRNEGAFILRSLGAVLEQDYPADRYEVLVADGMSTDDTREAVAGLAERSLVPVTIVDNPGRIVPTGMNQAIRQARGEVIVRVDGHTVIAEDYISQSVDALQKTDADNVGGCMDAVNEGPFGRAAAVATSSRFGVGNARFHYSKREEWVDTVYLGAWRREVFERIGLFDEEQVRNQDDEFNYRLRAHDGRILLSPRIRSRYYNRSSVRSLWRQYFQYGYWKIRVMQKHCRQMQPRQFAPASLVACLTLSLLTAPFSPAGRWVFCAVAAAYLLANLLASLCNARQAGRQAIFLPIAFATLHFAYGTGFLLGLFRFSNMWWNRTEPQVPTLSAARGPS